MQYEECIREEYTRILEKCTHEEALAGKGNPSWSGKQIISSSPIDVPVAVGAGVVAVGIVTTTTEMVVAGSTVVVILVKEDTAAELAEPNTCLLIITVFM